MSTTTEITRRPDTYALGHTPREYERLRAQARDWEAATARILDQISLPADASCLDAGCGPGETTRLLAQRVGPGGRVLGIDVDASIGTLAVEMLHGSGYRHCAFRTHDLTADEPVPGGPFDLMYARPAPFVWTAAAGRVINITQRWLLRRERGQRDYSLPPAHPPA